MSSGEKNFRDVNGAPVSHANQKHRHPTSRSIVNPPKQNHSDKTEISCDINKGSDGNFVGMRAVFPNDRGVETWA